MIVYVPTPITSVEQAEALPVGTVAHRVLKFESIWETVTQPEVAVKVGLMAWQSTAVDDDAWDWLDRHLVGWTALVPIEAEEETVACGNDWSIPTHEGLMPNGDVVPNGWTIHARLVTPWEEA